MPVYGSPTLIMHSKFQDEMLHPNKILDIVEAHMNSRNRLCVIRGELRKGGGGS